MTCHRRSHLLGMLYFALSFQFVMMPLSLTMLGFFLFMVQPGSECAYAGQNQRGDFDLDGY